MIKEFDGSQKMMEDIIYIDSKSFKDIDSDIDELCESKPSTRPNTTIFRNSIKLLMFTLLYSQSASQWDQGRGP